MSASRPLRHLLLLPLLLVVASAVFAPRVHAQDGGMSFGVVEPNGLRVPTDEIRLIDQGGDFETDIDELFECAQGSGLVCREEPGLDWQLDASDEPNTFLPLCDFTATLVLHEAGNDSAVGWYNVDPGRVGPPGQSEIYEILPSSASVGDMIDSATIREDPNYAGGLIGFALEAKAPPNPRYHFTERELNPFCDMGDCAANNGGDPGHWILSLTYQSVAVDNAFYVAFEDGPNNESDWSNDGDFNDYVFFFTGITCEGAGQPCTVEGADGVCAQGLTECNGSGPLTCRPQQTSSAEICDGLDNDCDGEVDEVDGAPLCGASEVCQQGACIGSCGEFGCEDFTKVCTAEGFCIDPGCVDVDCSEGEVCFDGQCRAPCDGVVCPGDQVCRQDVCADPCEGVACDEGSVCEGGVCVQSCACSGCASGFSCDMLGGQCEEDACDGVDCAAGTVCEGGSCIDLCAGALCPPGQVCRIGECVDSGIVDGGVGAGGGGGSSGSGGGNLDGGTSSGGGSGSAGSGGGSGSSTGDGGVGGTGSGGDGCGCHVAGGAPSPAPGAFFFGLAALGLLGRRHIRSRRR